MDTNSAIWELLNSAHRHAACRDDWNRMQTFIRLLYIYDRWAPGKGGRTRCFWVNLTPLWRKTSKYHSLVVYTLYQIGIYFPYIPLPLCPSMMIAHSIFLKGCLLFEPFGTLQIFSVRFQTNLVFYFLFSLKVFSANGSRT